MKIAKNLIIAIDGPAASGKGTVAQLVADVISYTHLDTGAVYRVIALKALEGDIKTYQDKELLKLCNELDIKLFQNKDILKVMCNGKDVTEAIRTTKIDKYVAQYAANPLIQEATKIILQNMAKYGGYVIEGRQIGSDFFPHADVKIFLSASAEERAKRRQEQYEKKNIHVDYETILQEIKDRDELDMRRKVAPLRKAEDAIEVDSTNLSIQGVVDKIVGIIGEKVLK